jgi:zinc protease
LTVSTPYRYTRIKLFRLEVFVIGKRVVILCLSLVFAGGGGAALTGSRDPSMALAQRTDPLLPTVKRDTLLNGLQLIVMPQPGSGAVRVRLRLNKGALFDLAGKGGLADITAGMLLRGGGGYTARNVADTARQLHLEINIKCGWDATDISITGPASSFEPIVDLLGRLVITPAFDQKELDSLKTLRIGELISQPLDGLLAVRQKALGVLFGRFPYSRPEEGTADSIAKIGRDDVAYYYKRFYLANSSELAVSGDVTPEDVTKLARSKLGLWKKDEAVPATFLPPSPPTSRQITILDSADPNSAEAALVQIGISRRADDYLATAVMTNLIGTLAGKDPATSIQPSLDGRLLPGPIVVTVKSPADKIAASVDHIIEAMQQLRHGQITPDQIEQAKQAVLSSYLQKIDTPEGLMEALLDIELYGLGRDYTLNLPARVQAITINAVTRAATSHLSPEALVIVVSGPATKLEPELRKLGDVAVVKDHQALQ